MPPLSSTPHGPAPAAAAPPSPTTPLLSPMEAKTFTHEDICSEAVNQDDGGCV
jgi:hypothetical protein